MRPDWAGGRSQQGIHKQSGSRCGAVLLIETSHLLLFGFPTFPSARAYLKLLYSMLCRCSRLDLLGYWPIVWQERDYCPLSAVTDIPLQG